MSLWRSVTRAVLLGLVLPLSNALPSRAAPDENGWFEAPSEEPAPESVEADPATEPVEPAPAPAAADMQSVPPSPLLEPEAAPPAQEPAASDDRDPRALSDFRPTLDPYGSWVNHPTYGTVWVPRRDVVGTDFAPYVSAGNWALDVNGNWVWMSDYPFGGVVFHYGRWVWIAGSGWAWIPGFRYAPAWVSWRVPTGAYAYVGWAPLGPSYVWFNGVAVGFGVGLPVSWVFCPSVNVFHRHVRHYIVRDRVVIARAAANTRRYTPAYSVRGRTVVRHSGPALASARVPAYAVPRERVRQANRGWAAQSGVQRRSTTSSPRSVAPTRSVPSRTLPGRSYQVPGQQQALPQQGQPIRRVQPAAPRSEPAPRSRPSPRSQPEPRVEPRRYPSTPRFEPAPRRMEPMRSAPRMEPMRPAPRMIAPGGGGRRFR